MIFRGFYFVCKRIVAFYFLGFLIGAIIYVFFPNSIDFWGFLASHGIIFHGDPHTNRFISIYFDPNYYSSIVLFPLFTSLYCFLESKSKVEVFYIIVFSLSIFLSGSRSGFMLYVIMLLTFILRTMITSLLKMKVHKKWIYSIIVTIIFLFLLYPIYIDSLETMVGRIDRFQEGSSAYARLISAQLAINLIKEHMFLGLGYNYMASYMMSLGLLSSVDSSILGMLVTLGVPIGGGIILFSLYLSYRFIIYNSKLISSNLKFMSIFIGFYIIFTILFTSNFNNLLFYFYWIVPVFSFSLSFWFYLKREKLLTWVYCYEKFNK
jgi:hypothetical protein